VNLKGKYGFIELDDADDAEDAVKDLDGKSFNGGR
jgi:RNA recognition motif-containing protein